MSKGCRIPCSWDNLCKYHWPYSGSETTSPYPGALDETSLVIDKTPVFVSISPTGFPLCGYCEMTVPSTNEATFFSSMDPVATCWRSEIIRLPACSSRVPCKLSMYETSAGMLELFSKARAVGEAPTLNTRLETGNDASRLSTDSHARLTYSISSFNTASLSTNEVLAYECPA